MPKSLSLLLASYFACFSTTHAFQLIPKPFGHKTLLRNSNFDLKENIAPIGEFFPFQYEFKQSDCKDQVPTATETTKATNRAIAALPVATTLAIFGSPEPALAAAGPVPSAVFAWFHFLGVIGVAGGLAAERFLIKKNISIEDEMKMNNADLVYGISAFSLLISGYFRVTEYAKGWDFYKNEPIFWVKMASVAVLGALSLFPAIILFQRDQIRRKEGTDALAPLSDGIVDRMTTIINAEILAVVTIPLFASLMARGVLYVEGFPWVVGVLLYAVSLGGAGFKYGKEALSMMEQENTLELLEKSTE